MKMYCITINDNNYEKIKKLGLHTHGLVKILKIKIFRVIKWVKIYHIKIHIMEVYFSLLAMEKSN